MHTLFFKSLFESFYHSIWITISIQLFEYFIFVLFHFECMYLDEFFYSVKSYMNVKKYISFKVIVPKWYAVVYRFVEFFVYLDILLNKYVFYYFGNYWILCLQLQRNIFGRNGINTWSIILESMTVTFRWLSHLGKLKAKWVVHSFKLDNSFHTCQFIWKIHITF